MIVQARDHDDDAHQYLITGVYPKTAAGELVAVANLATAGVRDSCLYFYIAEEANPALCASLMAGAGAYWYTVSGGVYTLHHDSSWTPPAP